MSQSALTGKYGEIGGQSLAYGPNDRNFRIEGCDDDSIVERPLDYPECLDYPFKVAGLVEIYSVKNPFDFC
ncbi:hypothetical protein AKJ16_DCAP11443 [Drosera capensis]